MINWKNPSFPTNNDILRAHLLDDAHYITGNACIRSDDEQRITLLEADWSAFRRRSIDCFSSFSFHAEGDHFHFIGNLKESHITPGKNSNCSYRNTIDRLKDNFKKLTKNWDIRFTKVNVERQIQYCYKEGKTLDHTHGWPASHYEGLAMVAKATVDSGILKSYHDKRTFNHGPYESRCILARCIISDYAAKGQGFTTFVLKRVYSRLIFQAEGCDSDEFILSLSGKIVDDTW